MAEITKQERHAYNQAIKAAVDSWDGATEDLVEMARKINAATGRARRVLMDQEQSA